MISFHVVSNLSSIVVSLNSRISEHFKVTKYPLLLASETTLRICSSLPLKSTSIATSSGLSRIKILWPEPTWLYSKSHLRILTVLWTWGKTKPISTGFIICHLYLCLHSRDHPTSRVEPLRSSLFPASSSTSTLDLSSASTQIPKTSHCFKCLARQEQPRLSSTHTDRMSNTGKLDSFPCHLLHRGNNIP